LGSRGEGAVPSIPIKMVSKITDYRQRRQKMIKYLGNKCVFCNCKEHLQFDHIDHTTKSFDISSKWSTHWTTLVKELNKCQLLCKECHKKKTLQEGSLSKGWANQPRQKHGTVWSYAKYKCRCDLCKAAKKASMAK
jgi:hypothetical protein